MKIFNVILSFTVFFTSHLCFSQTITGKIEYDEVFLNGKKNIGILYFNADHSLYKIIPSEKKSTTITSSSDGNKLYPSNTIDSIANKPRYIFNEITTKNIYSTITNNNIESLIVDRPVIKWRLVNEYKEILNYLCQKAIGELGGKKYISWFTKDLPLGYGPLKISGLQGVILELSNDNMQITEKKLSLENYNSMMEDIFSSYDYSQAVTLEQYDIILMNQLREKEKLYNGNLDKNSRINFDNITLDCKDCNK